MTDTSPLDEIEILIDEYGESHVYADDGRLLGYTHGYVQAGDQLFLMDVIRHIGYGSSARVLGAAQIISEIEVKRGIFSEEEIERPWESALERMRRP